MLGKVSLLPCSGDGTPLESAIIAASRQEAPFADLPGIRVQAAATYPNLTPAILKQLDEQALPALLAISDAIRRTGRPTSHYENWGLVAAGRSLGRKRVADSIVRFRQQGAWTVSPHVIPNCSLHSISGIMSQALRLHGPNIGAGGVCGAESEALWAAMGWLHGEKLPGVWLVLTAWDHECTTFENAVCRAIVVGLMRDVAAESFPSPALRTNGEVPEFRFEELWDVIEDPRPARWAISGADCIWLPQALRQEEAA